MGRMLESYEELVDAVTTTGGHYLLVAGSRVHAENLLADLVQALDLTQGPISVQNRPYPMVRLEGKDTMVIGTSEEHALRVVRGRLFEGILLLADDSLRDPLLPYLTHASMS